VKRKRIIFGHQLPRNIQEKKEKRKRKKNLHSPPPSPNYLSRERMVEKENYQREKEVTQEENRRKEYGDEKNYHENRILD